MNKKLVVLYFLLCISVGCILTPTESERPYNEEPELAQHTFSEWILAEETFRCTLQAWDPENDPLSYALIIHPAGMQLYGNQIIWTPAVRDSGIHTIAVQVSDGQGGLDTLTFQLKVNVKPNFLNDPSTMIPEVRYFDTYIETLHVIDLNGDSLIFYQVSQKSYLYFKDSIIEWHPSLGDTGTNTLSIGVHDSKNGRDTLTWNINVYVNYTPKFKPSYMTNAATIGIKYQDTLFASDLDGNTLSFTLLNSPAGMILTDSFVIWTPVSTQAGSCSVSVKVEDPRGLSDTLSWSIYVNTPPYFSSTIKSLSGTLKVGIKYSETLEVVDPDDIHLLYCFPDTVTNQCSSTDPDSNLSAWGGVLTWTPDSTDTGSYTFTVCVHDQRGGADTLVFSSFVEPLFNNATPAAAFPPRMLHASVVYNNKMWVIGGTNDKAMNDVWYSSDGVEWLQATDSADFSPRYGHRCVVFDNKMWIIGGSSGGQNNVWYSTDGAAWAQTAGSALLTPRMEHTAVVFNGKIWVQGGANTDSSYTDTWYSNEGLTWTRAHNDIGFTRRRHSSVVFDSKIWLLGGQYLSGDYLKVASDIAYSDNGIEWQVVSRPAFSETQPFGSEWLFSTSTIYKGKIWLIGGANTSTTCHRDIRYSENGLDWQLLTWTGGFPPRVGHTALVFQDKLWIIGGSDRMYYLKTYKNDVWYMEEDPTGNISDN